MRISSLKPLAELLNGLLHLSKKFHVVPTVPPHEVTHFEEQQLGSGSFGTVYLGLLYGERVAIKVPKEGLKCPRTWRTFVHEVSILVGHSHQNVISLRGFCLDTPCIITEYCPNGSLFDLLGSQKYEGFGWSGRLKLAIGIARGMVFLHSQKRPIIHRDLKSSNVVLRQDNTPVITDFGLAGTRSMQDIEGLNPTWQAPEVALEGEKATLKSDVYSFAIIMWEILTGDHPWKDLHPMAVLFQMKEGNRLDIPEDLPMDWEGVDKYVHLMTSCWAQEPRQRPTFKDICKELELIWTEAGLHRSTENFSPIDTQASDSPPNYPENVGSDPPKRRSTKSFGLKKLFLCHSS